MHSFNSIVKLFKAYKISAISEVKKNSVITVQVEINTVLSKQNIDLIRC